CDFLTVWLDFDRQQGVEIKNSKYEIPASLFSECVFRWLTKSCLRRTILPWVRGVSNCYFGCRAGSVAFRCEGCPGAFDLPDGVASQKYIAKAKPSKRAKSNAIRMRLCFFDRKEPRFLLADDPAGAAALRNRKRATGSLMWRATPSIQDRKYS